MKKLFKNKATLYGIPDSGDSSYSRIGLAGLVTESGELDVSTLPYKKARNMLDHAAWFRFIVPVTISTDENGDTVSGIPQEVNFIPRYWDETDSQWASKVFKTALEDIVPSP